MSADPLQLCPLEKWPELEDIFKADWPRSISTLTIFPMQRYMLQRGLNREFKVYCPYGNVNYGFVAINIEKGLYEVIVQSPSDDTSELEDALKTTSIIDWKREIEIPFVPVNGIKCIKRVSEIKNLEAQLISGTTYMLDKSSPLFNVKFPPELSFELILMEHIDLLQSTWPHRYEGCNVYFELIINANLGYGLYKGKQLISWALVRETGSLLHLFTLEEERRKGYGELVLKLISNFLLKRGQYVVAYYKIDNVNAAKMYQKLNFKHASDIDWCTLVPKS